MDTHLAAQEGMLTSNKTLLKEASLEMDESEEISDLG